MISVRRTVVGALCLPLLLLGACGDGDSEADEPSQSPSVSETPTVTPSPNETETVLPEDLPADQVTPEEIVAAWIDAYNELTLTGDGSRFRAMSATSCVTCGSIADQLEEIYASGGSSVTDGAPNQLQSVDPVTSPTPPEGISRLRVEIQAAAGETSASSDSPPVEFPSEQFTWVFDLQVVDGRWRVVEVGI